MTEREHHDDGPTPEQLARGEFERVEIGTTKADVRLVHRRVDSVRLLHKRKQITLAQYAAAVKFQNDYRLAALDPLGAAPLDRIGGGPADAADHIEPARRRVAAALKAVGGHGSLGALVVEHVLGLGYAIERVKEHLGVRFDRRILTGALVAALGVLARNDSRPARFRGFGRPKTQGIDKSGS